MKTIVTTAVSLILLAACSNVKNSEEYKALLAERDSLASLLGYTNLENNELQSLIDEIDANFDKIKAAENYLTVQAENKDNLSGDNKQKIEENFAIMNDILKQNKEKIAQLNKRLTSTGGENAALKSTIERLNGELDSKIKSISVLQEQLAASSETINKLSEDVKTLNTDNEALAQKTEQQAATIESQDQSLHTAYYIYGSKNELKELKLVSGGFLASTKLQKDAIDANKFEKIDIRRVSEIPLFNKKAKLMSQHPETSYKLEKDANGNLTLKIVDYQKFWSLTTFLVIMVG